MAATAGIKRAPRALTAVRGIRSANSAVVTASISRLKVMSRAAHPANCLRGWLEARYDLPLSVSCAEGQQLFASVAMSTDYLAVRVVHQRVAFKRV